MAFGQLFRITNKPFASMNARSFGECGAAFGFVFAAPAEQIAERFGQLLASDTPLAFRRHPPNRVGDRDLSIARFSPSETIRQPRECSLH